MLSSFVTLFLMLMLVMFPLLIPLAITVAPTVSRLRRAREARGRGDQAGRRSTSMSIAAARLGRPASA